MSHWTGYKICFCTAYRSIHDLFITLQNCSWEEKQIREAFHFKLTLNTWIIKKTLQIYKKRFLHETRKRQHSDMTHQLFSQTFSNIVKLPHLRKGENWSERVYKCLELSSSDQCPVAQNVLYFTFLGWTSTQKINIRSWHLRFSRGQLPFTKKNLTKQSADSAFWPKLQNNALPVPYAWPTHAALQLLHCYTTGTKRPACNSTVSAVVSYRGGNFTQSQSLHLLGRFGRLGHTQHQTWTKISSSSVYFFYSSKV